MKTKNRLAGGFFGRMKNIMNKKTIILVITALAIILSVGSFWYIQKNKSPDQAFQNEGTLGNYTCLSKFQVKSKEEYSGEKEIFDLDFFQNFSSGAFFGKIKNYKPELNKQFASFINQLMKEKKVTTYLHLEANVCLYHQDLYNPENGAGLDYYIEHYYCTNSCQWGKYQLRVDLDADGNFVGYRETTNIY